MDDLVRLLKEPERGGGIEARHGAERPGEVKHSAADITRAQHILGYEAGRSFEEGLADTIEWYRKMETDR